MAVVRLDKQQALSTALQQMGVSEFWIEELECEPFRNMFGWYRSAFTTYSDAIAKSHRVEPIPFLFLNGSKLNAVAFRHSGHNFTAMNWGAVILLHDLFYRLLASPTVLPAIGEVQLEAAGEKLERLQSDAIALPHPEDIPFGITVGPTCATRAAFAEFLTQVALDFLYIHEHQHAAGGHLEYFSGTCNRVSEVDDDDLVADILTKHVLEFEAEAAAANFSLKLACDIKGNAWHIPDQARAFLATPDQRYSAWLFAILTLFIVVERANRDIGKRTPCLSTHPSPILMRAFFVMLVFVRQVPFAEPDQVLDYATGVLTSAYSAIQSIVDEPIPKELRLDLLAPSRNAHMRKLGERWRDMHHVLTRLGAPTGTLPVPNDLLESFVSS